MSEHGSIEERVARARQRLQDQINMQAATEGRVFYPVERSEWEESLPSNLEAREAQEAHDREREMIEQVRQDLLESVRPLLHGDNQNNTAYTPFPESEGWTPELIREYESYRDDRIDRGLPIMVLQSWIRNRLSEEHYQPIDYIRGEPVTVDDIPEELPGEEPMEEATHENEVDFVLSPDYEQRYLEDMAALDRAGAPEISRYEWYYASGHLSDAIETAERDFGNTGIGPLMFEAPTSATAFTTRQQELQERLDAELARIQAEPADNTEDELNSIRLDLDAIEEEISLVENEIQSIHEFLEGASEEDGASAYAELEEFESRGERLQVRYERLQARYAEIEERRNDNGAQIEEEQVPPGVTIREGFRPMHVPAEAVARPQPTVRLDTEGIRVNTAQITYRNLEPNSPWINTDSIRAEQIRVPKRYTFDGEKINNTVTIIRAFQAILQRYDFTEQEIERFGIKDLVVEKSQSNYGSGIASSVITSAQINNVWV